MIRARGVGVTHTYAQFELELGGYRGCAHLPGGGAQNALCGIIHDGGVPMRCLDCSDMSPLWTISNNSAAVIFTALGPGVGVGLAESGVGSGRGREA